MSEGCPCASTTTEQSSERVTAPRGSTQTWTCKGRETPELLLKTGLDAGKLAGACDIRKFSGQIFSEFPLCGVCTDMHHRMTKSNAVRTIKRFCV